MAMRMAMAMPSMSALWGVDMLSLRLLPVYASCLCRHTYLLASLGAYSLSIPVCLRVMDAPSLLQSIAFHMPLRIL